MSVPTKSFSFMMAGLIVAGGLACRKPAPVVQEQPPVAAPAPAKPADQTRQNEEAAQKRKAEEAAEAARQAEAAYQQAATAALKDIHFGFDKSEIMDNDKPVLMAIAAFMKNYPQANITIDGNCDERGTGEYNLALGERRAHATMDYLVSLGVPAARSSATSYGKEKPVCTESVESCWSRNRRAHFTLK